jgi:hypothetical protein
MIRYRVKGMDAEGVRKFSDFILLGVSHCVRELK